MSFTSELNYLADALITSTRQYLLSKKTAVKIGKNDVYADFLDNEISINFTIFLQIDFHFPNEHGNNYLRQSWKM